MVKGPGATWGRSEGGARGGAGGACGGHSGEGVYSLAGYPCRALVRTPFVFQWGVSKFNSVVNGGGPLAVRRTPAGTPVVYQHARLPHPYAQRERTVLRLVLSDRVDVTTGLKSRRAGVCEPLGPCYRSMMRRRRTYNPKRRIRPLPLDPQALSELSAMVEQVQYGGNPEHKRHPGDFGLVPPISWRAGRVVVKVLVSPRVRAPLNS